MFQIFIPGVLTADAVEKVGLLDLTRGGEAGPTFTEFPDHGPDGRPGLLVEYFGATGRWDQSQWEPCWFDKQHNLPAGRFLWGFPKGNAELKLDPDRLAYKKQVKSVEVKLADGQGWLLPNMALLPHRLTLNPATGDVVRAVHPDWSRLYTKMCWALESCREAIEHDAVLYRDECCDYLIEVLAVNYRLNRELAYRLQLFDDSNWAALVSRTVDREKLQQIYTDLEKKRAASNPNG